MMCVGALCRVSRLSAVDAAHGARERLLAALSCKCQYSWRSTRRPAGSQRLFAACLASADRSSRAASSLTPTPISTIWGDDASLPCSWHRCDCGEWGGKGRRGPSRGIRLQTPDAESSCQTFDSRSRKAGDDHDGVMMTAGAIKAVRLLEYLSLMALVLRCD